MSFPLYYSFFIPLSSSLREKKNKWRWQGISLLLTSSTTSSPGGSLKETIHSSPQSLTTRRMLWVFINIIVIEVALEVEEEEGLQNHNQP